MLLSTGARHVIRLTKDIDLEAQAETLILAAKHGIPFCEECERRRSRSKSEAAGV